MKDEPEIMNKEYLALDDERFRRENTEKLVKTVESVGSCMVEAAKTSKAMYRYIYIYMGIIVALLVLVIIGYIWSYGTIQAAYQSLFVPLDGKKIVTCFYNEKNISFKKVDFESLYYFKQSLNASCSIIEQ